MLCRPIKWKGYTHYQRLACWRAMHVPFIRLELVPIECIKVRNTINPFELMLIRDEVSYMLVLLTERKEYVLCLRYGLCGLQAHTLEEIGIIIGVTGERVRQIEAEAIRELQRITRINKI